MAKAHSVRLEADLMNAATSIGKISHRSAVQQIEYWAEIGKTISDFVSPVTLLEVQTGLKKLSIEPIAGKPVKSSDVFMKLKKDRESGALTKEIKTKNLRYQASNNHAGMLEQILPNGKIKIGTFVDGQFKEYTKS